MIGIVNSAACKNGFFFLYYCYYFDPVSMLSHNLVKASPKDFFLHLLAVITLYASAVSFGAVLFQIINLWVPDPLEQAQFIYQDSIRQLLRQSLSTVVIMFPVYLAVSWELHRSFLADKAKRYVRIRRWLLYFTLFVAALVIIGSLVSVVNHLLNGELTLRFVLKLLSVFFIAGSIGGYYLWELRRYKAE